MLIDSLTIPILFPSCLQNMEIKKKSTVVTECRPFNISLLFRVCCHSAIAEGSSRADLSQGIPSHQLIREEERVYLPRESSESHHSVFVSLQHLSHCEGEPPQIESITDPKNKCVFYILFQMCKSKTLSDFYPAAEAGLD